MRSVDRESWPLDGAGGKISFSPYRKAKPYIVERIGNYCSYCERKGDLHVEHVVPKSKAPSLEEHWENLLLGCVNCNSRKDNKNDARAGYMWPDDDRTDRAFEYRSGGRVALNPNLRERERKRAQALFDLVGLGATGSATDSRRSERRRIWELAEEVKVDLKDDKMRNLATKLAAAEGCWSVWMTVFDDDSDMRKRFIAAFPGTRP